MFYGGIMSLELEDRVLFPRNPLRCSISLIRWKAADELNYKHTATASDTRSAARKF